MKKLLLVFLVLAIIGLGGYFGWRYYDQSQANVTTTVNTPKKSTFVWGVTTRAFALGKFTDKQWQTQVKLARNLGVEYLRISWEPEGWYNSKLDPSGLNQALITEIEKQDMEPYLIFGENGKMTASETPYQDGYDLAYKIGSLNKGKVDYYQLGNEISSEPLKGGEFPGDVESQYDLEKYAKIRDYLKGAIAGLDKADPAAKTVVVGQWTQTAFFDMLQKDEVDYDVIGWDWFSDMGLMKDVKISDGTALTSKLQSFNKPIMLVEVGQRPDGDKTKGFVMDEDKQLKFISDMAEWAQGAGFIKGFFAFELTDLVNYGPGGYADRYGLVGVSKNTAGKIRIIGTRKAYDAFAAIVNKYSK